MEMGGNDVAVVSGSALLWVPPEQASATASGQSLVRRSHGFPPSKPASDLTVSKEGSGEIDVR